MYTVAMQREGMGLLEYQTMPSLREVAHGGWFFTFTIEQQLEVPSARSWEAPVRIAGTVQERQGVICPPSSLSTSRFLERSFNY